MRRVRLPAPRTLSRHGAAILLLLPCAVFAAASAAADDAPRMPPLDTAAPAETRTATFALG